MPEMTIREMTSKGGRARAANMTPAQRSEAARKAARERWAKDADRRITCSKCQAILANQEDIRSAYDVGLQAKPEMGHAQFFTSTGRTAICVARRMP